MNGKNDDSWEYVLTRKMPPFRWRVMVLRNGREVGDDLAETRWGARRAARKIKRRRIALDRAKTTSDRGAL